MGDAAKKVVFDLRAGQVCLLENLRIPPRRGDGRRGVRAEARRALRRLRRRRVRCGSTARTPRSTPSPRWCVSPACGFLLVKEIEALGKVVDKPEKPFIAVLGARRSPTRSRCSSRCSRRSTRSSSAARWPTRSSRRAARTSSVEDRGRQARPRPDHHGEGPREGRRPRAPGRCGRGRTTSTPARARSSTSARSPRAPWPSTSGRGRSPSSMRSFDKAEDIFWNGPMGLFEKAPFANGTFSVAKGIRGFQGLHGHRRRRQRPGGERGRRGRGGEIQPHLDRRRRLPRAHRGEEAAGIEVLRKPAT